MQKGGQGRGAGSGLMLLLQTADVQHKVYDLLIVALPIPSGLEIVRNSAGTLIHLRIVPPHLGQHPADPLLHLPAGGKPLDEVAQMHRKPGIRKALFVERNIQLMVMASPLSLEAATRFTKLGWIRMPPSIMAR